MYDGLSFSDFKRVSSMTRARCFGTPNYLISVLTFLLLNSAASAKAEETAIEAIIANYEAQCQAMQAEVLPDIDADLDAPPPKGILEVNAEAVFDIEIDLKGNKATVVHADFGCTNFGYPWCGISGSCTSYLIVDDVVFAWEGGGRPETVKGHDTVLIIKNISGFSCTDSMRSEGFGASPCYKFAVWDEERATFWSADGDVTVRQDLSPP